MDTSAATDPRRRVGAAVAAGRVAYGAAMALAPRRMLRLQTGTEPSGPFVWLARIFGIRDAVLGAGVFLAGGGDDRRRWVAAGAVADSLDVAATVTGVRLVGGRSAVAALGVAGAAAAAGWWSLAGDR